MNEERHKILDMLSQGKISVDDAERLLQALGQGEPRPSKAIIDDFLQHPLQAQDNRIQVGSHKLLPLLKAD